MKDRIVRDVPAGPTEFDGLNCALKQTLALKQDTIRPPRLHDLLRMLIRSGVNETRAITTATRLDLKAHATEPRDHTHRAEWQSQSLVQNLSISLMKSLK